MHSQQNQNVTICSKQHYFSTNIQHGFLLHFSVLKNHTQIQPLTFHYFTFKELTMICRLAVQRLACPTQCSSLARAFCVTKFTYRRDIIIEKLLCYLSQTRMFNKPPLQVNNQPILTKHCFEFGHA